MRRSACLLRICAGEIHGVWHGASWGGGGRSEADAAFAASEGAPSLGDAIDQVLAALLPAKRLTSPFVCVSLEGSHLMTAILSFPKLPKAQKDRRLIVSQRFCRDHRLDPAKVEVIARPLERSACENKRLLCLAVERDTLTQIRSALEKRGLHPDLITPEYMLKFEQAGGFAFEKPGMALFEEHGFRTVLVWDKQGSIAHVANVRRPVRQDLEGQRRMAARMQRYGRIVASEGAPVAVYVEGLTSPAASDNSGLKLLKWPGAPLDFGGAAK